MATITRKVCDLCQKDGELADAQSTQIGLDRFTHEADLCKVHKSKLLTALEPFLRAIRTKVAVSPARKAHPPRQRMPCPKCRVMFTPQGLANHTPSCHGEVAERPLLPMSFFCDVPGCGAAFERGQGLGSHRWRGHGIRKDSIYRCSQCERSFTDTDRISEHLSKEHNKVNAVVSR